MSFMISLSHRSVVCRLCWNSAAVLVWRIASPRQTAKAGLHARLCQGPASQCLDWLGGCCRRDRRFEGQHAVLQLGLDLPGLDRLRQLNLSVEGPGPLLLVEVGLVLLFRRLIVGPAQRQDVAFDGSFDLVRFGARHGRLDHHCAVLTKDVDRRLGWHGHERKPPLAIEELVEQVVHSGRHGSFLQHRQRHLQEPPFRNCFLHCEDRSEAINGRLTWCQCFENDPSAGRVVLRRVSCWRYMRYVDSRSRPCGTKPRSCSISRAIWRWFTAARALLGILMAITAQLSSYSMGSR